MHIIKVPNEFLRKKCAEVEKIDRPTKKRIKKMIEVMRKNCGVGLSAPQVGWSVRLFVIEDNLNIGNTVYINPTILERTGTTVDDESCLSIPGVVGRVERSNNIKISATDVNGDAFEIDMSGYPSRVIQHEFDHLDGVLITDKFID